MSLVINCLNIKDPFINNRQRMIKRKEEDNEKEAKKDKK